MTTATMISTCLFVGSAAPASATMCTGDTCQAAHSSQLAIAHDYNHPDQYILYPRHQGGGQRRAALSRRQRAGFLLVLYHAQGTAPWATSTNSPSDPAQRGANLCFQADGNLVIYDASGTPLWGSATADAQHGGNGGRRLAFNGPCEVAILNADNQVLWSTDTSCG